MDADELRADDELCARLRQNLARFERQALPSPAHKPAAVAVVIAPDCDGQACFVLTRRAARLRAHAGQWALPGGRIDAGEQPEQAALRELAEEVGLVLASNAAIGRLDDYATRSGYVITPVVIWHDAPACFALNPHEVAAAYTVPLRELGGPEVPRLRRISESDRPVIQVPLASLNVAVHAPTAAILYQFWEVAVLGKATRVVHYEQPVFAWS